MPDTWYFRLGDLFSNMSTGVLVALTCYWLIDSSWPMLVAMIVSMALGMFLSMLLAVLVLMRFFGAMEVMLPTMVSGMWAGMVVGMRASMSELSPIDACLYGLLTSLVVIALCWATNGQIRGKQHNA